jgi:hypothetical protein
VLPLHQSWKSRDSVLELLERHNLDLLVPDAALEALSKEVQKSLVLKPRPKKSLTREQAPRKRLLKALGHAKKLLEYKLRRVTLADSVKTRYRSLDKELNHLDVRVFLTIPTPYPYLERLIQCVEKGQLTTWQLRALITFINRALRRNGAPPGRPWERRRTIIVRAGCNAWRRSGCALSRTWNPRTDTTDGALADFIRDLLTLCRLTMTESALDSAIKEAIPDIERRLGAGPDHP